MDFVECNVYVYFRIGKLGLYSLGSRGTALGAVAKIAQNSVVSVYELCILEALILRAAGALIFLSRLSSTTAGTVLCCQSRKGEVLNKASPQAEVNAASVPKVSYLA